MRSALTLTLILGGCYELFDLEPAASGAVDEQRSSSSGWAWVEAGREVTCATSSTDATMECWGDMDGWEENRDTGTDHLGQIPWGVSWGSLDSGSCEFCGLSDAGEVTCWGCRVDLADDAPSGRFEHIETSLWTACAAPASGPIQCWGTHWEGGGEPEGWSPPEAPVLDISVAREHACALMPDGTLSCFGSLGAAPTGSYTLIDGGEAHHCGLRVDGTVNCWGNDDFGQISGTPSGTFVDLTAGSYHTCAIDSFGEVTCWGYDEYGLLEAPGGPLRQLSGGGTYTCGIRDDDGTIHCWGYNHWGQFPT